MIGTESLVLVLWLLGQLRIGELAAVPERRAAQNKNAPPPGWVVARLRVRDRRYFFVGGLSAGFVVSAGFVSGFFASPGFASGPLGAPPILGAGMRP